MERDLDLIKTILLDIEHSDSPREMLDLEYDDYTNDEVAYHLKLLHQAGLIEAQNLTSFSEFEWKPTSLTWHGHEFLDAARNDTVWSKTKDIIKEKGGTVPFTVLNELLKNVAMSLFDVS